MSEAPINKSTFLARADVQDFVGWAALQLPQLPICLKIGRSRFVPNPVTVKLTGIQQVKQHYIWKSHGMATGDWHETQSHLASLANRLRQEVTAGNDAAALTVCRAILTWGGNRNWSTGAFRFLTSLPIGLCDYLRRTELAFRLSTADTSTLSPPVLLMNSMLTKVHALLATDGLPIYDSRVAAATASLIEMWRVSRNMTSSPLPIALSFPATLSTRTVLRRYPAAVAPGVITYGSARAPADWSSAKVRLAWLMESVLTKIDPGFDADPARRGDGLVSGVQATSPTAAWPHATLREFEAALFVIGYDVSCLRPEEPIPGASYEAAVTTLQRAAAEPARAVRRIQTLSGRGTEILYGERTHGGHDITWGALRFALEAEVLADIIDEFDGRTGVPLGAGLDSRAPASLGQWLLDNGWPSSKYASAIAAVLVDCGTAQLARQRGRAILLDFDTTTECAEKAPAIATFP